jgi:ectoine hydroxylase-related dioxygenase (phytanoyl-CoA dioxygenase family)
MLTIFHFLKNYFSTPNEPLEYKAEKHTFFRDSKIMEALHSTGYYVVDFLGEKERLQLLDIYGKYHKTKDNGKGAFFGEMSENIHYSIEKILLDSWNKWFVNYKSVVNGFVVKTAGEAGYCPIHQDVADIDELKYSSINIWIPLQPITPENGALHIVPRSQHIFVPYRAATIDALTKNIEHLIYPYFIPLYFELGQALFFDARMFHHSPPNSSDKIRLAAFCRICPKEADVITYFQENGTLGSPIEMFSCPDDYVVHSTSERDNVRPVNCKSLGFRYAVTMPLTAKEFERRRKKLGIKPGQTHISV